MDARLHHGSNVLVSGVTGLIGGELFRQLTTRLTAGRLWALVRPTADLTAAERLDRRLRRSGDDRRLASNVRALPGDVLEGDWGLGGGDRTEVVGEVDLIVHSAADTSFAVRRDTGRTNVLSVTRLIDLARACTRQPLVVYISTAANVGAVSGRCLTETEGCCPDGRHHNEYTRSKAVGEKLLLDSGLPVLVLRPSIVLSAGLPDAAFARQILWCAPLSRAFRALPLDPAARLDIVDVGFVAEAAVRLMALPGRRHDTYHLSAGERGAVTMRYLAELVAAAYGRTTPIRLIPPTGWGRSEQAAFVRPGVQRKVFRSLRTYLPFLNMDVVYDDARLRADLGHAMPEVLPPDLYLPDLLQMIGTKAALREAAVP